MRSTSVRGTIDRRLSNGRIRVRAGSRAWSVLRGGPSQALLSLAAYSQDAPREAAGRKWDRTRLHDLNPSPRLRCLRGRVYFSQCRRGDVPQPALGLPDEGCRGADTADVEHRPRGGHRRVCAGCGRPRRWGAAGATRGTECIRREGRAAAGVYRHTCPIWEVETGIAQAGSMPGLCRENGGLCCLCRSAALISLCLNNQRSTNSLLSLSLLPAHSSSSPHPHSQTHS